ncbi:UNVERIFIED_CONTAM: hypothetical protein H355_015565 [Colinus virginianus]|nr:hypothetical protein H355_015565 [Colinus virginianus]
MAPGGANAGSSSGVKHGEINQGTWKGQLLRLKRGIRKRKKKPSKSLTGTSLRIHISNQSTEAKSRVTVCALVLYFYRGGNLSKNMYSELLNSTGATEAHLILQTNTPYLGSTQRPVSSSAFYMSTARVLKEGEINKPDLLTYIILFFFLLLTVTLIVLFINCQLKNSFFATLPYDRSLREARSPWRTQAV